jgi:hypothetical protein
VAASSGRRPAAAQQDKPAPVSLNLDTLEREGGTPEPFVVVLAGERLLLSDPAEVDWQKLMAAIRDPHVFFRLIIPPDDHKTFFDATLPGWKMNKLMQSYMEHYGLPSPGEAVASPAS